ncbi:solute carrier family 2, facilitated glucose transporter member 11 [Pholidichthys leucotaenia]
MASGTTLGEEGGEEVGDHVAAIVQSFLRLASYYRKFVKDFATITSLLHQLIQKGHMFEWSENCAAAFSWLCSALIGAPMPRYPDPNGPFIMATDASNQGIGAVLSREGEHGEQGIQLTLVLMVASAAIGGTLQYGYNLAIMNAPTAFIQAFINKTFVERWDIQLKDYQVTLVWTVIVSIFSLGGLIGALIAGPLTIRFGRKKCLLLNNIFLMSAALFAVMSKYAKSFEMIIISRVLVGINAGISMNVQPMYFGESAPKHLRGAISLSSAVFTAFGVVLGQVVGLRECLGSEPYWHYLLASNAIPGLIQLLTLPWFPESPRYLLIDKGDKEGCFNALRRLRGCEVQNHELDEILQERAAIKDMKPKRPWELFTDRSVRWQLISILVISSAMQLCGNDSIYFYASYVFKEAGISADKIQYVTIGTGTCEFTACIMCNLLIERKGRRFMLMGGFILMTIWAVVFTIALSFEHYISWMPCLNMTCIFTYILSFGMGPAGVTGVLPTEIFNHSARPAAYVIAGSMMWINLFIVGMIFPFLVSELREYCFVPFGAVCLLSALYVGLFLPETKGKTLSVITQEFHKLNFKGYVRHIESQSEVYYRQGEVCLSTAF